MIDLEVAAKTFRSRMQQKYSTVPNWEDAYQEGVIRMWKDIEAGNTVFKHVINRADMWARNVMFQNAPQTGEPRRSHTGRSSAQGVKSREKIKLFLDEYMQFHDKMPTNKVISQSTGVHPDNMTEHLRKLREGGGKATFTDDVGRINRAAYSWAPLEIDGELRTEATRHLITPGFEDSVVSEEGFWYLIADLPQEDRDIIVKRYYLDWSTADIGRDLGFDKFPAQRTNSRLQRILKTLRKQHENT